MECGFWPAAHHLLLCEQIERLARGEIGRLMVFMPPGRAKSTYTSILAPAWIMAQPTWHGGPWDVLACSHGASLAEKFSRKVRRLVADQSRLLKYGLSAEIKSAERWETSKGDVYRCAGVGAGISGERGDLGLIDDPIRNREQADSEREREKIWEWYTDDFRNRLKPNAGIGIIQTRWHEDDLSGRILPADWAGESGPVVARDGETWQVVCLPNVAERKDDPLGRRRGEHLWPEWYSKEHVEQEQRTMPVRTWNALHQQRPAPEDGDYFRRDWFQWVDVVPRLPRYFLCSDFAVSDDSDADYTVHHVWGVDTHGALYLVDHWRGQETPDRSIDAALDLAAQYRPAAWINEKGVIMRSIGGLIRQRMKERNVGVPMVDYARTADKSAMARGFQGRASMGLVHLPRRAEWVAGVLREWLSFPAGKTDDEVDPAALLGLHMDRVVAPPRVSGVVTASADYSVFG